MYMRRGLGTLYKTDPSTGTVIDCDSWSNIFQGVCWNPFASSVTPVAPGGGAGIPITNSDGSVSIVPAPGAAGTPAAPAPSVPAAAAPAAVPSPSSGIDTTTILLVAGLGFGMILLMGMRR